MFSSTGYSNKTSKAIAVVERLVSFCEAVGLEAGVDRSGVSASTYLTVVSHDGERITKVRVSDHANKHVCSSDVHFYLGQDVSELVATVAARHEVEVPARFTAEAFAARSAAADKAATTRAAKAEATEAEMLAAVTEALRGSKSLSTATAGKVVDATVGTLPRAQRQRIAAAASKAVSTERALSAAGDDLQALASLGATLPAARLRLRGLVDAATYASLRPAGVMRATWAA